MKIAIFENEVDQVKNTFNIVNVIKYGNTLEIDYFVSSDECTPFSKITEYDFVFVDLDLSINSPKDGYTVIKEIQDMKTDLPICIITGAKDVDEQLKIRGLKVNYLEKPLSYRDVIHLSLIHI